MNAPTTPTAPPPRIDVRKADTRGVNRIGWLNARHSFSFGEYFDPARTEYHGLRVLNDDIVAPGMGFGTHPHRDMEILTWVLEGTLAHKDSMGSVATLQPGTAQLMSAGTGVTHSEFNASSTDPVHLLQIWIMPTRRGTEPSYAELKVTPESRQNRFAKLASSDGTSGGGSLRIGADAEVFVADVTADATGDITLPLATGRVAYVHVATGSTTVNGRAVAAGDAVTLEGVGDVTVTPTGRAAQVLAFSLPA